MKHLKSIGETISVIREDYEKGLDQLDRENDDRREEIVTEIIEREQLTENRSELATKLNAELGFEYVR